MMNNSKENEKSAFTLEWTIGMNPNVPLLNLSVAGKTRYFYVVANVGIIGTGSGKAQKLLQGHVSNIISASVSQDKQWLVTVESKPNIFLIVWNTFTVEPVKFLEQSHETGVVRVLISRDGKLISLLTQEPQQKVILWRWSNPDVTPMIYSIIPMHCPSQTWFTMIDDRSYLCTVGRDSLIFFGMFHRTYFVSSFIHSFTG